MGGIEKDYVIVRNVMDESKLLNHLNNHDYFAFDTETTGLNVRKCKVIGASFCGKEGEAYYVPCFYWDNFSQILKEIPEGLRLLKNCLGILKNKEIITFNGSFDIRVVKNNFGIDLTHNIIADAMLLKHTVEEEGDFALKKIAIQIQDKIGLNVEEEANKEQIELKENVAKNGGSTTKDNFEMYKADLEVLGIYACADADLTLRVANYYNSILENVDFFYEKEVMPLYKWVTIPMEEKGVLLDMPLIEKAYEDIKLKIIEYKEKVFSLLLEDSSFVRWYNDSKSAQFPIKPTGKFAQEYCRHFNMALPLNKNGSFSITKKSISSVPEEHKAFFERGDCSREVADIIQNNLWKQSNDGDLFNINSKKQLGEIVFDYMNIPPLGKTPGGAGKFDDTFIEHLGTLDYSWAKTLSDYNKLIKIKSTYIERFLENQEDGYFYFSYKQHGTISGRYGSDAQQLPRPKEEGELSPDILYFNNLIRSFFIAEEGRIFVDCDYESLEPHVFSHVSGDDGLRNIFRMGHDFYSTIAIATEKLENVSADKKADNYLGKVNKPKRQMAKAYCFTKDTLVESEKGLTPISSVRIGNNVATRQGLKKVTNTFKRSANVIRFHTSRGTLECTPDHRIWNGSEWKEAKDFVKGESVVFEKSYHQGEEESLKIFSNMSFSKGATKEIGSLNLDKDWGYFIGATLGDGIISIKNTPNNHGHGLKGYVGICGIEEDGVVGKVDSFLSSLGFPMKTRKKVGNCTTKTAVNSELCKIVYDTLELGDMSQDKKCKNLKVPDYLFNASLECKLAFIAGLLDTDGYVKKTGNTRVCAFTSKDHRLSTGVIQLLGTLGVDATYEPQWNSTYQRYYYTVRIPVASMVKLKELGIQNHMVVERKRAAFEDAVVLQNKPLNKSRFILSEDLGEVKEVFDITVEDAHEFFANGVLVHNCLGVPYGMTGYALGKSLDLPTEDAEALVEGYLSGFPNLKNWMESTKQLVKREGKICSEAGRIRHLPKAKELFKKHGDRLLDFKYRKNLQWKLTQKYGKEEAAKLVQNEYMDYKNSLNNSLNFQIQSLGASIVNQSAIAINKEFHRLGIDAWVCAQIHDQLIFNVPYDRKEECANIIKNIMQTNIKLSVDLKAPPAFSCNWKEGH
jgi:DNA polymerase I-like protein with 3'-5' exonuclease and polymerase domains/intein/homing endonuclease